jgi:hypothetical protein
VLPEDDADRQLANGFLLDPSVSAWNIQVLGVAGGWRKVLGCFELDHVGEMDKYPNRYMILLIDFDGHPERLDEAKAAIPANLNERVFVIGVLTRPEDLKASLGSYETIGRALAKDCRDGTDTIWGHDLLRHNSGELDRLREHVRPVLF